VDPFRSMVLADPLRKRQARGDSDSDYMDTFYRFLVAPGAKLECGASSVQTDIAFADFLATHFQRLQHRIDAMKRATNLRNDATHENVKFSSSQATEMSRLCRSVLDALR
jgi:hypothetical protein